MNKRSFFIGFVCFCAGVAVAVTVIKAPLTPVSTSKTEIQDRFMVWPQSQFILDKGRFVVAYDGRLRIPSWVIEDVTLDDINGNASRKGHRFHADDVLPSVVQSQPSDYKGSGFDRGHMVPAGDNKESDKNMKNSFLLSNVAPQNRSVNSGCWVKIEMRVRALVRIHGRVTAVTGPIFNREKRDDKTLVQYQLIGDGGVAVPGAFFKVVFWDHGNEAYIVQNRPVDPDTPLRDFSTTIEKVERAAGIVFSER